MLDVNKKIILFSLIILIVGVGVFVYTDSKKADTDDSFAYITDDYIGSWYFDTDSVEEREDLIEGIRVVDVWMKRIVDKTENARGSDLLLWHIDPGNMRYKISDALAYDDEELILDA